MPENKEMHARGVAYLNRLYMRFRSTNPALAAEYRRQAEQARNLYYDCDDSGHVTVLEQEPQNA